MPSPDDDFVEDPFAEDETGEAPADDSIEDPFADGDAPAEPDLVGETQAELGEVGDIPAGFLDGFLMNYGGELGEIGEGIGNVLPQVSRDENGNIVLRSSPWSADGVNPVEESSKTQYGSFGNLAGNVVSGTGLGLATGGVGGSAMLPGVLSQAAIQGAAGAVSGYGTNHSLGEAAVGGGLGLLLGGGGRALAGKIAPAAQKLDDVVPGIAPAADYTDEALLSTRAHAPAREYPVHVEPGELNQAAAPIPPGYGDEPIQAWSEGKFSPDERGFLQKMLGKAADALGGNPLKYKSYAASKLIRGLVKEPGQMGQVRMPDKKAVAEIMLATGGANRGVGSRLQARPDVPTLVWALQSVNASGDTNLPPDAQSRLDEALMSGDDSNVSSVYMQLSMAHPGFQKRMQREIESINNEDGT